jgi:hypothetical protein
LRKPTAFPSSATFGHPLSPARALAAVEAAATENEPTKIFVPTTPREERRLPENRDAFCRHDTRRKKREGISTPSAFAPALPLTPPTLCPQVGESVLFGPCKCHSAVTRDP